MKLSQVSVAVLCALATGFVHAEEPINTFDEVVVTANKYEENLSKTAGSVSVIEGEKIQKEGATELYDSLNREPGVSVVGGAGRPQNIIIRGMTGNRIVIVKDGIPMSDGFGAEDINDKAGRNSFDIATLNQVQVVKGASSTSHGSGAIGGAVILKSNTPEDFLQDKDHYVDASGTYTGISNKYRVASNLALRSGDTSSLLTAAYWSGEESRDRNKENYNREIDGLSAEYTLHHYYNDELLLKAKAEVYSEEMDTREGRAPIQKDGKWDTTAYKGNNNTKNYLFWIGAEYEPMLSWMDRLDSKIYYRSTGFDEDTNSFMERENNGIVEKRRVISTREFNDEVIGWSADFYKELDASGISHNMVYGFVTDSTYHDRPSTQTVADWNGTIAEPTNPFAPARSYSFGSYIQDSMSIGNWTTMLGLRFDAYKLTAKDKNAIDYEGLKDNTSSEFSPSASLAYQFTQSLNAYFSYKHGFRAPEYDKVYGYVNHDFVPITPFVVIPNFDLKEETSDSFELGSKYDDGELKFYGAVFYNKFKNFMSIVELGYNNEIGLWEKRFENVNGVETYGVESTVEYMLTNEISTTAKIGWVDGEDDQGENVRSLTPLEGNFSLNYDDDFYNGYVRLNWADDMDRTPTCATSTNVKTTCSTTSGWVSVDMGAGYNFNKNTFISMNVINVFDREYTRYQDVAGTSAGNNRYSTQPGRYFTISGRYAF